MSWENILKQASIIQNIEPIIMSLQEDVQKFPKSKPLYENLLNEFNQAKNADKINDKDKVTFHLGRVMSMVQEFKKLVAQHNN